MSFAYRPATEEVTRPLLDTEGQTKVYKLPARNVISKKTQQSSLPVDHGFMPSLHLFLTTLMCLFGGIFTDRGYLQSLIAVGTALQVLGLLATSFSTQYWKLFWAQGVCVGIGSAILGLLPVAVIAMYFKETRMLPTGIAATGSSFAGVVVPITLRYLFSVIGFGWSVRVLALVNLVTTAFPWTAMRLQSEGNDGNVKLTFSYFKDPAYSMFCVAFALTMAATFTPFFYIQEYVLDLGLTNSMAFGLLAIMNGANLFGRFVPNGLADRYGGINILLPLCTACIVLLVTLPLIHTPPTLITFSILYRFASGGVMILPAPIIANMSPNAAEMGVRMGLAYLCAAFGGLVGNPLSGAVKYEGDVGVVREFRGVWWMAAGIMTMGVAAMVLARRFWVGSLFGVGKV
ncbi:MFS general substrate transporter [Lentithecium fluviatile CBS 122367]|uniref:MFS general substrate transporter n=1 Tax=Lentithecium fluviatile CBS 122367 TaxID=1168545 RepID=A0A6G1J5C1_9PLEO|nr:MFS general substrate transporter [Lentithecium fluviatile CBS 122367]